MTYIDLTKKITRTAISLSVGFTVSNIAKNNTTPQNKLQKAELVMGGYILGSIVAELAEDWTDKKIEMIETWFKTAVNN